VRNVSTTQANGAERKKLQGEDLVILVTAHSKGEMGDDTALGSLRIRVGVNTDDEKYYHLCGKAGFMLKLQLRISYGTGYNIHSKLPLSQLKEKPRPDGSRGVDDPLDLINQFASWSLRRRERDDSLSSDDSSFMLVNPSPTESSDISLELSPPQTSHNSHIIQRVDDNAPAGALEENNAALPCALQSKVQFGDVKSAEAPKEATTGTKISPKTESLIDSHLKKETLPQTPESQRWHAHSSDHPDSERSSRLGPSDAASEILSQTVAMASQEAQNMNIEQKKEQTEKLSSDRMRRVAQSHWGTGPSEQPHSSEDHSNFRTRGPRVGRSEQIRQHDGSGGVVRTCCPNQVEMCIKSRENAERVEPEILSKKLHFNVSSSTPNKMQADSHSPGLHIGQAPKFVTPEQPLEFHSKMVSSHKTIFSSRAKSENFAESEGETRHTSRVVAKSALDKSYPYGSRVELEKEAGRGQKIADDPHSESSMDQAMKDLFSNLQQTNLDLMVTREELAVERGKRLQAEEVSSEHLRKIIRLEAVIREEKLKNRTLHESLDELSNRQYECLSPSREVISQERRQLQLCKAFTQILLSCLESNMRSLCNQNQQPVNTSAGSREMSHSKLNQLRAECADSLKSMTDLFEAIMNVASTRNNAAHYALDKVQQELLESRQALCSLQDALHKKEREVDVRLGFESLREQNQSKMSLNGISVVERDGSTRSNGFAYDNSMTEIEILQNHVYHALESISKIKHEILVMTKLFEQGDGSQKDLLNGKLLGSAIVKDATEWEFTMEDHIRELDDLLLAELCSARRLKVNEIDRPESDQEFHASETFDRLWSGLRASKHMPYSMSTLTQVSPNGRRSMSARPDELPTSSFDVHFQYA
jgi:hypothetical protein